jgi:hypothetical protein
MMPFFLKKREAERERQREREREVRPYAFPPTHSQIYFANKCLFRFFPHKKTPTIYGLEKNWIKRRNGEKKSTG